MIKLAQSYTLLHYEGSSQVYIEGSLMDENVQIMMFLR